MATEVADEQGPGPILSITGARKFDFLFLFHTPHTRANAQATCREVECRHPGCKVTIHELPISDPKDYSSVMGRLAREVQRIVRLSRDCENFVCVSSGTAEMRAAWFLLTALGLLPAKLLQLGSPADPLFGPANVKEVRLDQADWTELANLALPMRFFERSPRSVEAASRPLHASTVFDLRSPMARRRATPLLLEPTEEFPELESALQELGIFVGSGLLRQQVERAAIAAASDVPVLLLGETGTGKELLAKLVHRMSSRPSPDYA